MANPGSRLFVWRPGATGSDSVSAYSQLKAAVETLVGDEHRKRWTVHCSVHHRHVQAMFKARQLSDLLNNMHMTDLFSDRSCPEQCRCHRVPLLLKCAKWLGYLNGIS